MAGIERIPQQGGVEKRLEDMISRSRDVRAYLNTVVVRQYQKAQIQRWQSENITETGQWKPLTLPYAKRKAKKFASFPGGGKVVLTATGKLMDAATLRKPEDALKVVTNHGITIGVNGENIPYAKYVAKVRPFMNFSARTIAEMKQGLAAFIQKGDLSWRAG